MNFTQSTPVNHDFHTVLAMKTMGQRLKDALELRGMQPPELISATKLSKGAIYNILNDTTRPEKVWAETVAKICAVLAISRDWLVQGSGPMEDPSRSVHEESTSYQTVRFDPDKLAESIAALRQVAKNQGWDYDPETHPKETIYAYELRCAMPANPTTAQVIDFGAKVAQRLQQQQARGSDGPGESKSVGTAHRKRS